MQEKKEMVVEEECQSELSGSLGTDKGLLGKGQKQKAGNGQASAADAVPAEGSGCRLNELKIEAEIDKLPEVLSFIEEHLEDKDVPMRAMMQISLAAEEVFVNIASYAYPTGTGGALVKVGVENDPAKAVLVFIDQGIPYNPLEKEDPDVTLSAAERRIGGLGIYLTKQSMDEVAYEYKDGHNILTLKKRI